MSSTLESMTDAALAAVATYPRRSRRIARCDEWALLCRVRDALAPYCEGVKQWLVEPRIGETPAAYARRAALYAAQRIGAAPDPAILGAAASSVRAVLDARRNHGL